MKKQALNPYLPSWEYVPDGEPYVFNVKVGDKMPAVMNTEIIVEDEKIIEIRN